MVTGDGRTMTLMHQYGNNTSVNDIGGCDGLKDREVGY